MINETVKAEETEETIVTDVEVTGEINEDAKKVNQKKVAQPDYNKKITNPIVKTTSKLVKK